MDNPPPKYFRLYPGNEVRLKHAYFIRCEEVVRDADGRVAELLCTYDPETKSGSGFSGRKVKGTIHWVSADDAAPAEFRLYEPLVRDGATDESDSMLTRINPNSLEIVQGFVESSMKSAKPYDKFQFFRHGYFSADPKLTTPDRLVFNRVVSLKSSFGV